MRIDEVAPSKININKLVEEFRDFFKICMEVLDLDKLPKIQWISDGSHTKRHRSFGSFHNNDQLIQVEILNRHPIDIMRTLAHELVHYKQWTEGRIKPNSGETGSPEENEAHIKAGIIMRYFDRRNPEAFQFKPITESATLNELFDQPYPIKDWDWDGEDTQAQFDIEDGMKIIITWKRITVKAYELMFTMARDNPKTGEYEVTFAQTNTGNAPRIFATVLAAHKEWLKKFNPEYLYFSAKKSEGGRVGLYAAMVKKLAGMFGYTTVPQDQIPPDVKQYMDRQGEVGHFLLKSKTAKPDQYTLPEIEYFKENRTNPPGTWQDIVQYMSYIANKRKLMAAGLTGDAIAKTLSAEGKTNPAAELKGLSDRQKATGKPVLKSWNEYFDLIKNAYNKTNEDTEEAAGVGIITKQNTTGDVNKGSIRKNLKAFKL